VSFRRIRLRNETNSLYRKRIRGEPVSIDDADLGPEVAPEVAETVRAASRLARDETRDEVGRALAGLSPEDRELVVLRGVEQHPPRDLARLLGVRPNTISARYRRALEKLRRLLPPDLVADLADDGGPNERAGEPTAEPPGEPPGE
ncbi:MAG: RNA polymerase sigma factor, partial [Planctomycetota bacterium JB042]